MHSKIKILFICFGNICRSPIAHAIMQANINHLGLANVFEIESKGTCSFHINEPPDSRSLKILHKHNIIFNHNAQQITTNDLYYYDYILAMDHLNYEHIISMDNTNPKLREKVFLLRSFEPHNDNEFDMPDPYYCPEKEFEEVYNICVKSINGFINFLLKQNHLPINNKLNISNNL